MQPPTSGWFPETTAALVETLARQRAGELPGALAPSLDEVAGFLLRQHGRMTDFLRGPMRLATAAFAAAGLRRGSRFHRLPLAARLRQAEAWRNSPLGFQRDFIRFFESLTTLALDEGVANPAAPAAAATLLVPTGAGVVADPGARLRCDVAVIGSGPGGAITAALLAEAGRDVLLMEEGPFLPLESCPAFSRLEMEQKYRNGGLTVALGRAKIAYVEGCCVGGGSEINSGLYHRTPSEALAAWRRDFRVEAATERDLEPHFAACERDLSVSLLPGPAPAASLKLHEGAQRLGWRSLEVPRWFRYEAGGGGPPQGARQTMSRTFLPRFLAAGGRLLPEARATRLRREGGGWEVEAEHRGRHRLAIQAQTVFVCGGAVQTPGLLRRSGLGHNVGRSLRLHPTAKVVARFAEEVNAADMGVPVHQVKEFAPRFSFGCSISSPPYLALGLLDHPAHAAAAREHWRHLASYYAMITGEGCGSVRPLPGCRDPLVRYALTRRDLHDLGEALRKLGEALFAAGAVALYPGFRGAPALARREDLAKLPATLPAGRASLMTIHLFSSCPMGEDRPRCATDSFGRLHGVDGVWVNDASLLCTAPGVNPQGTIMALARRNALAFLGKL